jgi:predicted ribosome quality control (RQC) complex YloA/Tae2 family protein
MVKNENFEYNDQIFQINIGQTAEENWKLIDNANQNDLWFHIKNNPSCHVIINTNGLNKVDRRVIVKGACVCKENSSKFKSLKKIEIIYTQIKNIKKTNKVGSVITSNTKSIII